MNALWVQYFIDFQRLIPWIAHKRINVKHSILIMFDIANVN